MPYTLKTYKFRVTHVVDGDTLKGVFLIPRWWSWRPAEVEDKIRLVGVNTPEMKGNEQEAAERAKSFVFALLDGKTVRVKIAIRKYSGDWERCDFNRVLGLVYLPYSEKTLNELLIVKGYAKLFKFPEWMPKYLSTRFTQAESNAKKKKIGIWKAHQKQPKTKHPGRWFWWIVFFCALLVLAILLI